MTPAAANSLLKTLEEPSGSSLAAALDLRQRGDYRLPCAHDAKRFACPKHHPTSAAVWLAEQSGWPQDEVDKALRMQTAIRSLLWIKPAVTRCIFRGALEDSFSALLGTPLLILVFPRRGLGLNQR